MIRGFQQKASAIVLKGLFLSSVPMIVDPGSDFDTIVVLAPGKELTGSIVGLFRSIHAAPGYHHLPHQIARQSIEIILPPGLCTAVERPDSLKLTVTIILKYVSLLIVTEMSHLLE